MVQPVEEREPLLPTDEESVSHPNGAANGAHGHDDSKVAKVKQYLAKNGIVIFAATIVAIGIIVFGALVLKSESSFVHSFVHSSGFSTQLIKLETWQTIKRRQPLLCV